MSLYTHGGCKCIYLLINTSGHSIHAWPCNCTMSAVYFVQSIMYQGPAYSLPESAQGIICVVHREYTFIHMTGLATFIYNWLITFPKSNYIPYVRNYKPRILFYTPFFIVANIVEWLILQSA